MTQLVTGRCGPEAPLPCAKELRQGIADADLVVFEESGHMPFIEESVLFGEIVGALLKNYAEHR